MGTIEVPRVRDRSLSGKVAVVTGAGCRSDGIGNGRAIAILLAEEGCSVLCVDLVAEWAEKTVEMIKHEGRGSAAAHVADVSKEAECQRIVEIAVKVFGRLDILINNVGIAGPLGTAVTLDTTKWQSAVDINLTSMIYLSRYAIPEMQKNEGESKGSIVNISSIAGLGGGLAHLLYATTKGAIISLTKNLAFQHGREGIRANCVVPGSVWTPLAETASSDKTAVEAMRTSRREANMLGIEGTGWDTGYAVRWLVSPEARWVTGVILPVDAGVGSMVTLTPPKMYS